jgi:tetratricopeptide (TPR) repeat protein
MVESISKIQQLMAESRFVEVQKLCESEVMQSNSVQPELLELYFESLLAQSKLLPHELVLTFIEKMIPTDPDKAQRWLGELKLSEQSLRIINIKISLAEKKGRTEHLNRLISDYQILRFQTKAPILSENILQLTQKYFKNDFQLQLQRLALDLMRMDLVRAEEEIKGLILSCFERSSSRGTREKLQRLLEVLQTAERLFYLEVYKTLCIFLIDGIQDKKDYKKTIELIIFFEDFRLQVLLMDLMWKAELNEICEEYAGVIRKNQDYSYVYFDKYFPHLKSLFYKKQETSEKEQSPYLSPDDLKSTEFSHAPIEVEQTEKITEDELLLSNILRHQSFSGSELLEIAVSFLQSEFYLAGLKASEMAFEASVEDKDRLKSSYLKVFCLLKLGDFRAALDCSMEAIKTASTQNDVLSFLYAQAEAYIKLKDFISARAILKKIITIDSGYRLARERLDKLNAI